MLKINLQSLSEKLFYFLLVVFPLGTILGFAFSLKTGYILNALVLVLFLLVVNKLNKIDFIILFSILLVFTTFLLLKLLLTDTTLERIIGVFMDILPIFYFFTLKGLFAGDNLNIKTCTNIIVNNAIFHAIAGSILFFFLRGFDLLLIVFNFDIVKFGSAGGSLNKASGLMLNANVYSNYLLLGIILIILRNEKLKLKMLIQLAILLISVFASGSRYAVAMSVLFVMSAFIKNLSLKSILTFSIVFLLMLVFVFPIVNSVFKRSYFYENRADKNVIALNALKSNSIYYIVGIPNSDLLTIGEDVNESFSDNSYLKLILNLGLPLALYLVFFAVIKPTFKIAKNGFSVLFALYLFVILLITNSIYWFAWLFNIYFIIFYIDRKNAIGKKENYCEEYGRNN